MITLTQIRELDLAVPSAPGRPSHLSAASGLVRVGSLIYVVADDELHLGVFQLDSGDPGQLIRIFDGALPEGKAERKQRKPDLEALTLLPVSNDFPHGALLALGSGSRANRRNGIVLALDAQGRVNGAPRVADFSALFAPLEETFPDLNIEGAMVSGEELHLFQRANSGNPVNAVIRFHLADVLALLSAEQLELIEPIAIDRIDLGTTDGIPYGFTDAAALPDGETLFIAVAEDTGNAYDDGPCAGAVIGILDRQGRVRRQSTIDRPCKVEGVDARLEDGTIKLLLVTDADDPGIPAKLFSATMAT
ncbi:MAG TPA: hypothetical protein VM867_08920 [Xanthobacteraceae bacterium]|nr:hypothetical protein [Xanthobacteraceae bacterium]